MGLKIFLSANKSIVIFISFLSILSMSTTGYLLMTNKKQSLNKITGVPIPQISKAPLANQPKISPPSPTPTPKPLSASLKIDSTASWSAFTSSKYSYSIKYPPQWTAKITTQQDPKILEYVIFNPVATKAGTLSITLSYGTRTYTEALALDPQVGEAISVVSASATKKNSKDSNGNRAANIVVPFGSNTIIFNAKDAFSSLFNQMLTTLNFTK